MEVVKYIPLFAHVQCTFNGYLFIFLSKENMINKKESTKARGHKANPAIANQPLKK